MISHLLDSRDIEKVQNNKKIDALFEKKEAVYMAAIDRLLQIRRGFDYTRETIILHDKNIQEEIDKNNSAYAKIAPELRLYATDKIFNQFMKLSRFAKYSYSSASGLRLIENSKEAFDISVMILACLMQEVLMQNFETNSYES